MAPTLYSFDLSPPVRAVLMTAKAIGLDLNLQEVDLYKGEHKTPEYAAINPQQTVPTLVDEDGTTVWDSHAISAYLITKYSKDDSLYPGDVRKRAVVDQRLHFDSGIVYPKLVDIVIPLYFSGKTSIDVKHKEATVWAYGLLEKLLGGLQWVAGDSVTIADYCLIATISSLDGLVPVDGQKFPHVVAWMRRCQGLEEYQENVPGLTKYIAYLNNILKDE